MHLELVLDLSSVAFLACFTHFTGRRGCSSIVYSDNGTNFCGAWNELQTRLSQGSRHSKIRLTGSSRPAKLPSSGRLVSSRVASLAEERCGRTLKGLLYLGFVLLLLVCAIFPPIPPIPSILFHVHRCSRSTAAVYQPCDLGSLRRHLWQILCLGSFGNCLCSIPLRSPGCTLYLGLGAT